MQSVHHENTPNKMKTAQRTSSFSVLTLLVPFLVRRAAGAMADEALGVEDRVQRLRGKLCACFVGSQKAAVIQVGHDRGEDHAT